MQSISSSFVSLDEAQQVDQNIQVDLQEDDHIIISVENDKQQSKQQEQVQCEVCQKDFPQRRIKFHTAICSAKLTNSQINNQYYQQQLESQVPCSSCQRKFKPNRIEKHQSICQAIKNKKRSQTLNEKSQNYLQNIYKKCVKEEYQFEKQPEDPNEDPRCKLKDLDIVQCKHCSRSFFNNRIEKHESVCQNAKTSEKKMSKNYLQTVYKKCLQEHNFVNLEGIQTKTVTPPKKKKNSSSSSSKNSSSVESKKKQNKRTPITTPEKEKKAVQQRKSYLLRKLRQCFQEEYGFVAKEKSEEYKKKDSIKISPQKLQPCKVCQRTFAFNRIEKHEQICSKVKRNPIKINFENADIKKDEKTEIEKKAEKFGCRYCEKEFDRNEIVKHTRICYKNYQLKSNGQKYQVFQQFQQSAKFSCQYCQNKNFSNSYTLQQHEYYCKQNQNREDKFCVRSFESPNLRTNKSSEECQQIDKRVECQVCSRKFASNRIEKHQKICKANQEKFEERVRQKEKKDAEKWKANAQKQKLNQVKCSFCNDRFEEKCLENHQQNCCKQFIKALSSLEPLENREIDTKNIFNKFNREIDSRNEALKQQKLQECVVCQRKFSSDRIEKHQKICNINKEQREKNPVQKRNYLQDQYKELCSSVYNLQQKTDILMDISLESIHVKSECDVNTEQDLEQIVENFMANSNFEGYSYFQIKIEQIDCSIKYFKEKKQQATEQEVQDYLYKVDKYLGQNVYHNKVLEVYELLSEYHSNNKKIVEKIVMILVEKLNLQKDYQIQRKTEILEKLFKIQQNIVTKYLFSEKIIGVKLLGQVLTVINNLVFKYGVYEFQQQLELYNRIAVISNHSSKVIREQCKWILQEVSFQIGKNIFVFLKQKCHRYLNQSSCDLVDSIIFEDRKPELSEEVYQPLVETGSPDSLLKYTGNLCDYSNYQNTEASKMIAQEGLIYYYNKENTVFIDRFIKDIKQFNLEKISENEGLKILMLQNEKYFQKTKNPILKLQACKVIKYLLKNLDIKGQIEYFQEIFFTLFEEIQATKEETVFQMLDETLQKIVIAKVLDCEKVLKKIHQIFEMASYRNTNLFKFLLNIQKLLLKIYYTPENVSKQKDQTYQSGIGIHLSQCNLMCEKIRQINIPKMFGSQIKDGQQQTAQTWIEDYLGFLSFNTKLCFYIDLDKEVLASYIKNKKQRDLIQRNAQKYLFMYEKKVETQKKSLKL